MKLMSESRFVIGYCTLPNIEVGRKIVYKLLEKHLIACGNLIPGIESIYRWKGEIQNEEEILLILKTTKENQAEIIKQLPKIHPYEVPELIFTEITDGLPEYLKWVFDETDSKKKC